MVNQMLARFFCRRYAPLLVPYAENALNEPLRSRVARHLDACPACREEVALVSDMGALLRANPPATPAPADDLWKRIEAQILAEQPVQPARPIAKPIPVPITVTPRSQWHSFVTGFGYSAVPVAAVVAAVVLVTPSLLNRNQEHETDAAGTMAATAPAPEKAVEITIAAPAPKSTPATTAPPMMGRPASALNAPADTVIAPHEVASAARKQNYIRHRRSAIGRTRTPARSLAPTLPAETRVAVASKPKVSGDQLSANQGTQSTMSVTTPDRATLDTVRTNSPDTLQTAPRVAVGDSPSAAPPSAPAASPPVPGPTMYFGAARGGASGARAMGSSVAARVAHGEAEKVEAEKVEAEKKVALAAAEAVLPVREAPAERRVSDVTDQMFRHRNMFSYMR